MPATILSFATGFALVALSLALLLTVFRILRGPTMADRAVALDMLMAVALGFIAVIALRSGFALFIDIAVGLALVGFLTTVAFARYMLASAASPPREPPAGMRRRSNVPSRRRRAKR